MSQKLKVSQGIIRCFRSFIFRFRYYSMDSIEQGKKNAAFAAVNDHVTRKGMKIGVGSGSTVKYVVDRLQELAEEMQPICVRPF